MRTHRIRTRILVLAAALLTALCTWGGALAAGNAAAEEACGGVVRVYTEYEYGGHEIAGTGTGFFVGPKDAPVEYIITNAHVVDITDEWGRGDGDYVDEVLVIFDSYASASSMKARVIYHSDSVDLAILQLSQPTGLRHALPLRPSTEVIRTEEVFALGFPGVSDDSEDLDSSVDDVTVTKGTITKSRFEYQGGSYLQMDVAINSGNSGGPLIDAEGNVVGINSMTSLDGQNTNYALYVDYAMDWLDGQGVDYQSTRQQAPSVTQQPQSTQAPVQTEAPAAPVAADTEEPEEHPGGQLPLVLIAGGAAAVITAALLLARASRKRREAAQGGGAAPDGGAPRQPPMQQVSPAQMAASVQQRPSPAAQPGGGGPYQPQQAPVPAAGAEASPQAGSGRMLAAIGGDNPLAGRSFPIAGDVKIGRRAGECLILYPEQTRGVSREHCCIRPTPTGVLVIDTGSTFGTYLDNGARMAPGTPYPLPVGGRFYLATENNGFVVK